MAKIAFINTVCTGSHGRIMDDLRRGAQSAGHCCRVYYSRGPAREGDFIRFGSAAEVALHGAASRLLDAHGLFSRRATRQLLQYLDAFKPDLIHLHNAHGYYLCVPLFFDWIRRTGVPLVWTLHDCWALTGHCSHFVRAGCERWQTGCHDCPLLQEYPASFLLDCSRRNWNLKQKTFSALPRLTLVTPSQWLAGVVEKSFLQSARRRVIGNGVDLSLFTPGDAAQTRKALGVAPGQALLLAVAAPFDARKGFADALEIARLLAERAKVVLVGLTQKQLASLPAGVTGIARTDGPQALVDLYRAADCLLNPTYEDTYPTVNMEAMACGTPVAAYGVCGCTEQLQSPCGRSVPAGDVRALAQAAMALSEQKPGLSAICREKAVCDFDRTAAVKAYLELYCEALHES
ncbi:MAG TPA: glycosyltransferase [Candidatus Aphodomonas merdavium]|nr:glycosyltransferase [Candidatus Aphodomonas merdavium]